MSGFLKESASNKWWLVLLQGIALLILGFLLLAAPQLTAISLIVFLGVYWLVSGIFGIVEIYIARPSRKIYESTNKRIYEWIMPINSYIRKFVLSHIRQLNDSRG